MQRHTEVTTAPSLRAGLLRAELRGTTGLRGILEKKKKIKKKEKRQREVVSSGAESMKIRRFRGRMPEGLVSQSVGLWVQETRLRVELRVHRLWHFQVTHL